jgi:tRNA A37 threonylcarbamoyladenosine dehydratase
MLLGGECMERLKNASVAIFGVGGVGSYVAEALARSGVGTLSLFDGDVVCESNINRQLIATTKTLGRKKADVMKERIEDINPDAAVYSYHCFYSAENADSFDLSKYDYVVDAIDTVSSKLLLIENAKKSNVPIISSMGAGNKLNPTMFEVDDIYNTSVCPLAKVMRKELKARGIDSLKVVYSKEPPIKPESVGEVCPPGKRQVPGSVAFVPSVAGLIIAGEVVLGLKRLRAEGLKSGK